MAERTPAKAEPPLLSSLGLYLPSWAIALVVSGMIGVVSLAVESRVRLGQHEQSLIELRRSVHEIRGEARTERDRVVSELTALKVSLAAICAATNARCP